MRREAVHRVVSPPEGDERLSVPFFFNPQLASRIPLVPLPPELDGLKKPLIVGLVASPERIIQIRQNRLLSLRADHRALRAKAPLVVLAQPDDAIVFPGHGPATTIGRERVANPYLQGL